MIVKLTETGIAYVIDRRGKNISKVEIVKETENCIYTKDRERFDKHNGRYTIYRIAIEAKAAFVAMMQDEIDRIKEEIATVEELMS